MRGWPVLLIPLWAGCGVPATAPEARPPVEPAGPSHPLVRGFLRSTFRGNLSHLLGWQEVGRALVVRVRDGSPLLVVPLEAEDEIRWLTVSFRRGRVEGATALGLADVSDFSEARVGDAPIEGWFHVYDLRSGARAISSYREAGELLYFEHHRPVAPLPEDVLADPSRRRRLAEISRDPFPGVSSRVFLAESWEARMRELAPLLPRFLGDPVARALQSPRGAPTIAAAWSIRTKSSPSSRRTPTVR